ncbi:ABC transporter substrate-binding protein [Roseinatronobacter bogoriensis]|uniref:ABC transporter substrate-binding protein n=1 Tax=Roseinatronobacter bogoriensis subsp. barguzinensis TaxID=441209 RepID=A0A2K8KFX8_9RHOB|nr:MULTISPECIES: ABC transporter substrate-binding protein [Rhodobaca]ATX66665.1 ABC transporter substrate-binding protein [Rhodobaca barguzinensis]MBB4207846.1 NitT/TauT family transport system substrate-binding protein [Rhodobaca bogoriensis DSM 18756]TDW39848.1 NitT/TauT family transport system substrate-binding protein [Rhodobaca barguzinensis]TDY70999.1 NitT/TauT family transport system substrate-binding protein [Rhodobaca bogoriensis DSM 18756]
MFHRSIFTAIGLSAVAVAAHAQTSMPFALDWRFEGPSAPYFVAIDKGYFADAGLEVEVTAGQGSLDAIPKVATGAFPVGFADINSLIKFLDQNPDAPVIGAMMVYDKPPFAIVGRKSLGIETPSDLEGRVLGAPPPDGAFAQWPIFVAETGIDASQVTIEPVGFPTREPSLAEGTVAAVTGFSFTSFLSTARLGVPEDDLTVILMADHGVDLYGNVVIVNTDFAAENPDAVSGFLEAVAKGWIDTIADPAAAIESLVSRNPAMDAELELRRLELAMQDTVLTDWVMENGMGIIDSDRFANSIEQIKLTYEYQTEPDASLYFTDAFLPEGGFKLD